MDKILGFTKIPPNTSSLRESIPNTLRLWFCEVKSNHLYLPTVLLYRLVSGSLVLPLTDYTMHGVYQIAVPPMEC